MARRTNRERHYRRPPVSASRRSFSYRFALPDGQYELPVTAVSADGTEAGTADLNFSRSTEIVGEVGSAPLNDPA